MKRVLLTLALLLALVTTPGLAQATGNDHHPTVVTPQGPVVRATYEVLSAAWWRWALSIPAAQSPLLLDQPDCGLEQSGPVWFLAGNVTQHAVIRRCTIPRHKSIFFPLMNTVNVKTEPQETLELFRQMNQEFFAGVTSLFAVVDGMTVANLNPPSTSPFRTESPVFSVRLPAGNLFGVPAGTYSPALGAGFYVLVLPPAPGRYRFHFGGAAQNGFSQDITYDVTVTP